MGHWPLGQEHTRTQNTQYHSTQKKDWMIASQHSSGQGFSLHVGARKGGMQTWGHLPAAVTIHSSQERIKHIGCICSLLHNLGDLLEAAGISKHDATNDALAVQNNLAVAAVIFFDPSLVSAFGIDFSS